MSRTTKARFLSWVKDEQGVSAVEMLIGALVALGLILMVTKILMRGGDGAANTVQIALGGQGTGSGVNFEPTLQAGAPSPQPTGGPIAPPSGPGAADEETVLTLPNGTPLPPESLALAPSVGLLSSPAAAEAGTVVAETTAETIAEGILLADAEIAPETGPVGWVVGGVVAIGAVVTIGIYEATKSDDSATKTDTQVEPQALPRKYENQKCEEQVRLDLEQEKKDIGDELKDDSLKIPKNAAAKTRVPCSKLKERLDVLQRLLAKRKQIQDECFPGDTDQGHDTAMAETTAAIDNTQKLMDINCAEGHPMAGL